MKNFGGKLAVITGTGTGIGRELALQLASEGCHLAICDVLLENMAVEPLGFVELTGIQKHLTEPFVNLQRRCRLATLEEKIRQAQG